MIDLTGFNEAFLDLDIFAQEATYVRLGYASVTIPVIFDNAGSKLALAGDAEVETLSPQAMCLTADVPYAAHGDTLTIDSKTYQVIGVTPDGMGVTTLTLSEVSDG